VKGRANSRRVTLRGQGVTDDTGRVALTLQPERECWLRNGKVTAAPEGAKITRLVIAGEALIGPLSMATGILGSMSYYGALMHRHVGPEDEIVVVIRCPGADEGKTVGVEFGALEER
jgi:hypothetical protein